jgi:hypothetical protein
LSDFRPGTGTTPMVAVKDLDRARKFYSGSLGPVPFDETSWSCDPL